MAKPIIQFPERFFSRINRNGPVPAFRPDLGSCHIWLGTILDSGYGVYWNAGVPELAHRLVYQVTKHRRLKKGKQIDHLCRVRACVNPNHLEAVTCKVNLLRGFGSAAMNARKTHCKRGHKFTRSNTYIKRGANGNKIRNCRICRRAYAIRLYWKNKIKARKH